MDKQVIELIPEQPVALGEDGPEKPGLLTAESYSFDVRTADLIIQAPDFKDAIQGSFQTCHRLYEKDPTYPVSEGNCQYCLNRKVLPKV